MRPYKREMFMCAETAIQDPEPCEISQVESLLLVYGGDFRHAISDLLADANHLRLQLALATAAMGRGFTRGWMPSEERDGHVPSSRY